MYYEKYMLIFILFLLILIFIIIKSIKKREISKLNNINEFSFQRYAKFFGEIILPDKEFENKIKKIYELIVKNKETDISKISKISNCGYDECILKIKYLKHKEKLNNYYIDTVKGIVKPCDKKDKALLRKYIPYIYYNHYQIDEIAIRLPHSRLENLDEIKEQILNELDYLDKKNLIHGLNIDKVDKKIIYYVVEKHKKEHDFISVNCRNCGALNDVPRKGKARCEYCETIIEDVYEK